MEFNEKLQLLRKQRGLTQEELAAALFVSRTAVSKWESGRGYPGIDSLREISKFFEVSIDSLLSGEEILDIAKEDTLQTKERFRTLLFSLIDVCMGMLFFLPLFRQMSDKAVQAVSLIALQGVQPYMKAVFFVAIALCVLFGIAALALQSLHCSSFFKKAAIASIALSSACSLIFILCSHPYAAAFSFILLFVKALMLIKKP